MKDMRKIAFDDINILVFRNK